MSQEYDFSPMCILKCIFMFASAEKGFLYWGHEYGFSLEWILLCFIKPWELEKDCRVYILSVFSGDSSGTHTGRMPCHTGSRDDVCLLCGFISASSSIMAGRKTLYTWCKSKDGHHSSGPQTEKNPVHTGGRSIVFLRCGLACVSSSLVIWKRGLHTWWRSKESRKCVSLCASSGSQTKWKPCNIGCRNNISLCCGF